MVKNVKKGRTPKKSARKSVSRGKSLFSGIEIGPHNLAALEWVKRFADPKPDRLIDGSILLLVGPPASGKSLLLNATQHEFQRASKGKNRTRLLVADNFMNELIASLQKNRMEHFRKYYREALDLFLLEDIHVLEGKEKSLEELFHILEVLQATRKRIILTSTQSLAQMRTFPASFLSRLSRSIQISVQLPDKVTLARIFQTQTLKDGAPLNKDTASLLASRMNGSPRLAEGVSLLLGGLTDQLKALGFRLDLARALVSFDESGRERSADVPSWSHIQVVLRDRVIPNQYQAWLMPLRLISVSKKRLLLRASNAFSRQWVVDHYLNVIREAATDSYLLPEDFVVEIR